MKNIIHYIICWITGQKFIPLCRHKEWCAHTSVSGCVSTLCNYHCRYRCHCGAGVKETEWATVIGDKDV